MVQLYEELDKLEISENSQEELTIKDDDDYEENLDNENIYNDEQDANEDNENKGEDEANYQNIIHNQKATKED